MRPYYEDIEKAELIDQHTIKFSMKKKYHRNFDTLAATTIVPNMFMATLKKAGNLINTDVFQDL